jgi:hypothetical protein
VLHFSATVKPKNPGGAKLRFPLRCVATLLVLLAVGLLAACGGSGDEKGAADQAAPAAADVTAAATPGGESATGETTAPAEAFANLQSYRIAMRFTLEGGTGDAGGTLAMDLEGSYVAPDRSQASVSAHLGDLELAEETITVGSQTWVKTGDTWAEGEAQFDISDLSPASLLQDLKPEQLRVLKPTEETVNGVKSLRYSIDRGDIESLGNLGALFGDSTGLENLPEDFNIDLWLAQDGGWPVRLTMVAKGAIDEGDEINLDFSLDITDVNDPGIEIAPPET